MQSAEDYISRINTKLQFLLKQFDALQKENIKLTGQVLSLQEKQQVFLDNVNSLQQQNLLLKASVTDMDDQDRKKLENQINHYLKNIDTCIALLSQ
ncbi:MAG: hypothetical protein ABIY51_10345 [Ferruginibacter sp.]